MELIELYIQEVTRRLPEKNRADIALELQSTIEDMLPDDHTEQDVKAVLLKLGDPVTLAGGYRDRPMHLIGPRYYDVYISLLKMILPIAAVISLIALVGDNPFRDTGNTVMEAILKIIGKGISSIISTGIQVFFWLTLSFAILERLDTSKDQSPVTKDLKPWTPENLKDIPNISKKKAVPMIEVFASLLGLSVFAALYFNAANLLGVYETRNGSLIFVTPSFNQDVLNSYWLLVSCVIIIGVLLTIYKLFLGRWTLKLAFFHAIYQLLYTLAFIIIISNPDLLNPEFLAYQRTLFSIDEWKSSIYWGLILISIIFAAYDTYQGFRKAKIR
ncbi:HAAS signaling domain-containing protein [Peribacillus sp. FSL R5-0717]|uniref:HAAS signaling domain-containing protein n=1 Tax=Peribacillus sp. FSL R5-0717 TaxID=2975308 RepID=UPI0030F4DDAB